MFQQIHCAVAALAISLSALAACTPAPTPEPPAPEEAESVRPDARSVIADIGRISTPRGVQESFAADIGGIPQWLSIRGKDRDNPALILLHGGPGSPELAAGWAFQTGWEDYFTVVQWDQRGAGKTWAINDPDTVVPTLTQERLVEDVIELVDFVRAHLGKDKVILMGHSWGSVIGLEAVRRHPSGIAAYIGAGQVVNMKRNEAEGYRLTLDAARAEGNADAVAALEALAPYPGEAPLSLQRMGAERRWAIHYGGLSAYRRDPGPWFEAMKLSPDYDDDVIAKFDAGSFASLQALLPALNTADFDGVTRIDAPVFLMLGRNDMIAPPEIAAEWLDRLEAPAKGAWWFENSAHLIFMEESGVALTTLVTCIRPYAVEPSLAAATEKARACQGGTPRP